jgi:transposase-like protein
MAPGASVLAVARRYDVHPRAIFRWKAKLIEESSAQSPLSLPAPGPKKRGRKPKNKALVDAVAAPKVFAVEPPSPPAAATSEGVRLVFGDLVITISTGTSR